MAYLICKKCGKQYPLHEGEESFYYENCTCGGKLEYSPTPRTDYPMEKEAPESKQGPEPSHPKSLIKWQGVFIGFSFLFVTLLLSTAVMMMVYGESIPTSAVNIPTSLAEIPIELLTLSLVFVFLTVTSGFISAYLSGSKKLLEGAINGGMVGLILGLILGLTSGITVFISGTLFLGIISMIGGVFGILPRRLLKK